MGKQEATGQWHRTQGWVGKVPHLTDSTNLLKQVDVDSLSACPGIKHRLVFDEFALFLCVSPPASESMVYIHKIASVKVTVIVGTIYLGSVCIAETCLHHASFNLGHSVRKYRMLFGVSTVLTECSSQQVIMVPFPSLCLCREPLDLFLYPRKCHGTGREVLCSRQHQ